MLLKFDFNSQYSVTIEENSQTVYAYYICDGEMTGDLWLLNLSSNNNIKWESVEDLPFLNKESYIDLSQHEKIKNGFDIHNLRIEWKIMENPSEAPVALIFYLKFLIGKLREGDKPGFSSLVIRDGPLANCLSSIGNKGFD